jgi:hypothetical protein
MAGMGKTSNKAEHRLVTQLDALAEFEEFREKLLPALQKDLSKGLTAEQILEKYAAVSAARLVHASATAISETAVIAAAEKHLDRVLGKPKQSVETTHKFKDLSDAELDAILKSELQNLPQDVISELVDGANED